MFLVDWQGTDEHIESALQESGVDYKVIRAPGPGGIEDCDIFYESVWAPKFSRQNFNTVRAKFPEAAFVLQLHNVHPNVFYNLYHGELKKWGLRDERYDADWSRSFRSLISEADVVFCHSEWVNKTLGQSRKPAHAIRVIPKGVDTNFWKPESRSNDTFCVGFSGQLQVVAGLQYLFEAWAKLGSPGALWVAGPRVRYVVNKKEIWSCGKVFDQYLGSSYKGWIRKKEDLRDFYNSLDVLVVPSLADDWSASAMEAMACGKPVIVTSTTGASQIVENGVNGFVIPPEDVEALSEKLKWCADNRDCLTEMGAAARETVLNHDISVYKQDFVDALLSCYGIRSEYTVSSPREWIQLQLDAFGGEFFLSAKQRVDENQRIIKVLKASVRPGARVLDVGCLDGSVSMLLQQWGCDVVACDLPEIAQETRKLHPDLTVIDIDLNHSFPEGTYDVIFASGVVEHLYNDYFFLCNCCKALQPGGTLVISCVGFDDWSPFHLRIYPERQFRTLLTITGFTHVDLSHSLGQRLLATAEKA